MYKKIRRFLCVPLTACFCTIAISYAQVASGKQTSSQSGSPGQDKVYVCQINQNNKPKTKFLSEKDVLRLVESKPDIWILGKCDDVISPSQFSSRLIWVARLVNTLKYGRIWARSSKNYNGWSISTYLCVTQVRIYAYNCTQRLSLQSLSNQQSVTIINTIIWK